jgi:hypothetical protein
LVETMAVARWRTIRLWGIERATLQEELEKHDPADHAPAPRVAAAFRTLADESRTLDLLHRYETRFDRQFSRSLNLLMKLAGPDNPLTQFRHTNPIPQTDTATDGVTDVPPPPPVATDNIDWGTDGAASATQPPRVEPAPLTRVANSLAPYVEQQPEPGQSQHMEASRAYPPTPLPRIGYPAHTLLPVALRNPPIAAVHAIMLVGPAPRPGSPELGEDDLSTANLAVGGPTVTRVMRRNLQ